MIRRLALAAVVGGLVLLGLQPAGAQAATGIRIREAALSVDGKTDVIVQVSGSAAGRTLSAANFSVTEEGQAVEGLVVQPLLKTTIRPIAVDLVMDTSGSTAGRPLADAKAAAKSFVNTLPAGVRIGLVSFGDRPTALAGFTTNKAQIRALIDRLSANGSTALYNAVRLSAQRLGRESGAQRNMVVFSDGADTVGGTTLNQAIAAARSAKAPVTSVGLRTGDFDVAPLNSLATTTAGQVVTVGQSAALASAFRQVAQELASQYVISYNSARTTPAELDLAITLSVDGATSRDSIVVLNSRTKAAVGNPSQAPKDLEPPKPLIGAFATKTGYYVGIIAGFLALLFFLGMLLWRPGGSQAAKVLQRGLRLYTRSDRRKQQPEGGLSGTAFGRRAVELVGKVPKTQALEARLQILIDRAGWPLRSTEFIIFQIGGLIVGAILGFFLFSRWWMGILLMAFGFVAPRLALAQAVAKRSGAFVSQLPDTLQLLSGSLQAGYAFLQALDTIVKEAPQPTSTEFSRVLAESRLGMPLEDALNAMSERVGSDDFKWVVLAINIQRQVGGNLAQLLTTVANTLREREQVRRQIKVLSAEGRLSAVILIALPFLLFGYISFANPSYLHSLTSEAVGKIMIAGAIVLIVLGALWMRKIIKIDV